MTSRRLLQAYSCKLFLPLFLFSSIVATIHTYIPLSHIHIYLEICASSRTVSLITNVHSRLGSIFILLSFLSLSKARLSFSLFVHIRARHEREIISAVHSPSALPRRCFQAFLRKSTDSGNLALSANYAVEQSITRGIMDSRMSRGIILRSLLNLWSSSTDDGINSRRLRIYERNSNDC